MSSKGSDFHTQAITHFLSQSKDIELNYGPPERESMAAEVEDVHAVDRMYSSRSRTLRDRISSQKGVAKVAPQ